MKLDIVYRSLANTDWHIGYLDGAPAVGDDTGAWYLVADDVAVLNRYDGYVYTVEDGVWTSTSAGQYDGDMTDSADITIGGPDYIKEGF